LTWSSIGIVIVIDTVGRRYQKLSNNVAMKQKSTITDGHLAEIPQWQLLLMMLINANNDPFLSSTG
jgi:hypothetical protein